MKIYKCQYCNFNIISNKNKKGIHSPKYIIGKHYEEKHKELLPPDMTGFRWFYFLLTKKDHGSCVICHNETDFNEISMKYSRFCNNPQCKQRYKEERDKRMIAKYGKISLLNDPQMQIKMQQGRKISGIYKWSDGKASFPYMGSYEKDFFIYLDSNLHWASSDVFAPCPHVFNYEYNGETHFYIPDVYIPSLNLIIEIKSKMRMNMQNSESTEKEIIKDNLMKSCSNLFNYIMILDKDYTSFESLIQKEE